MTLLRSHVNHKIFGDSDISLVVFSKFVETIPFSSTLTNSSDITCHVLRGGGVVLAFWIPLITQAMWCIPSPPQRHGSLTHFYTECVDINKRKWLYIAYI